MNHNKNNKQEKGITLLALAITIIVLAILAGVTINAVVGDNGIINQAKESKEKDRIAAFEEKLELWKGNNDLANHTKTGYQSIDVFIADLLEEGIISEDDVEGNIIKIGEKEWNLDNENTYIEDTEVEPTIIEFNFEGTIYEIESNTTFGEWLDEQHEAGNLSKIRKLTIPNGVSFICKTNSEQDINADELTFDLSDIDCNIASIQGGSKTYTSPMYATTNRIINDGDVWYFTTDFFGVYGGIPDSY